MTDFPYPLRRGLRSFHVVLFAVHNKSVIRPLMIQRAWSFGGRRFPRICGIATAIVGSPLDGPSN
jgi:hypothetical protein